jgi:hypothetical protein
MSLNPDFDFAYEFYFYENDVTDSARFDTIYNQCTIPDPSGNRKNLIYNTCLEYMSILSVVDGIHILSSFVDIDNTRYKVTLHNVVWTGDIIHP